MAADEGPTSQAKVSPDYVSNPDSARRGEHDGATMDGALDASQDRGLRLQGDPSRFPSCTTGQPRRHRRRYHRVRRINLTPARARRSVIDPWRSASRPVAELQKGIDYGRKPGRLGSIEPLAKIEQQRFTVGHDQLLERAPDLESCGVDFAGQNVNDIAGR